MKYGIILLLAMLTSCADLHVKEYKAGKLVRHNVIDEPTNGDFSNAKEYIESRCNRDSTLTGIVLVGKDTYLLVTPGYRLNKR